MTLKDIITSIIDLVNGTVIPVIFAIAFVYFLARLLLTFKDRMDGRLQTQDISQIVWGVLGLAVMVSVWGLVNIVAGTFFGPHSNVFPSSQTESAGSTSPEPPKQKLLPSTDDPG